MIYGSVCSGIEAATVAWHPLGWKPAFFSEIEEFPRAVLTHHYPEVPLHGDFTTIESGLYAPIDLLVGGTPCQSFSVAGLRLGLADERGNLALEYILLADRLRPRWLVWENVPGVFSSRPGDPEKDEGEDDGDDAGPLLGHNGGPALDDAERPPKGSDFAAFLSGLVRWEVPIPANGWRNSGVIAPAPVDGAYGVAWRVLDAQYFGVPQRRRRVFVVGYLGDWRRAAAVLFEWESLSGAPKPSRVPRSAPAGGAAQGAGVGGAHGPRAYGGNNRSGPIDVAASLSANKTGSGSFYDFTVETFIHHGDEPDWWPPEVADPITAVEGKTYTHEGKNNFRTHNLVEHPERMAYDLFNGTESSVTMTLQAGKKGVSPHIVPCVIEEEPIPFDTTQITHPENRSRPESGDPSPTLAKGGHAPAIAMVVPLQGKLSKTDSDDPKAGSGIGEPDDPMFTLGTDSRHAVAFAVRGRDEGAVPEVHGDGDTVGTLRSASGGSTKDYVAEFERATEFLPQSSRVYSDGEVSPALQATGDSLGNRAPQVLTRSTVRRLMPIECERLQAFPDGYTAIPWAGKPAEECPDGHRYKTLGNTMNTKVMAWIGQRIVMVEAL